MRTEPREREQRRAPLAQRHGLLAVLEGQELAEAVHPRRAPSELVLAHGGRDAGEVVAYGQHLPARDADREETPRLVVVAADRALDVGDEGHARYCFSFSALTAATTFSASWPGSSS